MKSMAMTSRFMSVVTLGFLCAFAAVASPIFVSNFSFETFPSGGLPLGCGTGCSYSIDSIPGWSNTGDSGQFQPGPPATTAFFTTLSDGPTVAYSNGPAISQTVAGGVVVGTTYTLMVDLGMRHDTPFTASADLLINGQHITATGTTPLAGTFSTFTATYLGVAADSGQAITIELLSAGPQGDFDNVRLGAVSAAATPEPAGVTLLGLGLAGVLVFARRKRAS
jgi:hypothetical protein